jgi:hypothetical protein
MGSRAIIAVALATALLAIGGCENVPEISVPGAKVVTREATVAAPAVTLRGDVPEGVPADLPLWPGATVSSGEVAQGSVLLQLGTEATYSDVVAGTSVGFERAGWTVTESAEEASATVLDVAGKGYEGVVTISQAASGATIDYVITESAQ